MAAPRSRVGATGSGSGTPKVLVAYFSRAGVNYFNGGRTVLDVGNTQVIAEMIGSLVECDLFRMEASDPIPRATTRRWRGTSRSRRPTLAPAIANPLGSIDQYSVVLLGSPIWNVPAPMIMTTFSESFEFAGKTVYPYATYAMSGLGTTERDYAASCRGATLGEGLVVRGEEVRDARPAVESWLQTIGLPRRG